MNTRLAFQPRRAASWLALGAAIATLAGCAATGTAVPAPDAYVRSTPENVFQGSFPIDRKPVVTVKSGAVVKMDTISHQGATTPGVNPVTFFGQLGVKPQEVLPDAVAYWKSMAASGKTPSAAHILTGPVYVEGAEPGDTLEVDILDYQTRVPYGINVTTPVSGVFLPAYPGHRPGDKPPAIPVAPAGSPGGLYPNVHQHLIRTGTNAAGKEVAFIADGIEVPLQMFAGTMGLAPQTGVFVGETPTSPPPPTGMQVTTFPGRFGGNMDNRDLTIGARLYLPVFQKGGQFYVGDTHGVQGDGEVSGTALEQSLTATYRFVLHKGKKIEWPRAEDDRYWILMGIDHDLNRAMKIAVEQVIDFLVKEKGMTPANAYSLASVGVNFVNSEVVDRTQVVSGKIPKSLFLKK
ncbi:MAG: acetamidase/formamidase family protein [Pseudomonadota bacterium]